MKFVESQPDYNVLCSMADSLPTNYINEMPEDLSRMFRAALARLFLLYNGTLLTFLLSAATLMLATT